MTDLHERHESLMDPSWWVGGWISPIIVVVFFNLLWVLIIYALVGDRQAERTWQYSVVPYVPGESILAIESMPGGRVPRQIELPVLPPGGPDESP